MLTENMVIRIAEINDAALLTTLSVITFRQTFGDANSPQDMDKYLAEEMNFSKLSGELLDKDNSFFFAIIDDVPIGYVKIRASKQFMELNDSNPLEIERLYVLKEYQGKKAGAALMAHCISHAASRHHDLLVLGVWEHNHKAIRFYQQWGFAVFGSHIFLLGDDEQTDVLMKKEL